MKKGGRPKRPCITGTFAMFVTEDLKSAVAEAQEFENNEIYTESMCLKPTKGGVGVKTFE